MTGWLLASILANPAVADTKPAPPPPAADVPAYPTSPYHGVQDGDGRIIPCRCRSGGRDYRLGETVCMNTAVGVVIARCDLMDNNTSWIPTASACELSSLPMSKLPAQITATAASR